MRYKITIEYDGTNYSGWQRQNGAKTIAGCLETALFNISGKQTEILGSGRTDAGVHAKGQCAHFDMEKDWDTYKLMSALNAHLVNEEISVLKCETVPPDFHARFSSKKRYYQYIILNRNAKEALDKNRVWKISKELNVAAMKKAAKHLIGNHDFSSFRSSQCGALSPVKTLDEIKITQKDEYIFIDVNAKSFKHHMVRNHVGTLDEVGLQKQKPLWAKEVLNAKDRTKAGITAPACGLYFMKVDY
ncbi:MAG: tRNA pseudouridine(38-40) synthase TruA [Rickettsiales bacterium]|jgi:tRNA pseudouridine38-40 synthase|nr:tRNA pseudouridine(38-40) synthase TruA [Rickettsiales bacterium]